MQMMNKRQLVGCVVGVCDGAVGDDVGALGVVVVESVGGGSSRGDDVSVVCGTGGGVVTELVIHGVSPRPACPVGSPVPGPPAPVPLGGTGLSEDGVASAPATPDVRAGMPMSVTWSGFDGWDGLEEKRSSAATPQPSTTATITAITRHRDLDDLAGTWSPQPSRTSSSATETSFFTRGPFARETRWASSYRRKGQLRTNLRNNLLAHTLTLTGESLTAYSQPFVAILPG